MDKVFHSQSWYRVAGLRPRLRRHARLYRTHYRGELWYVLQDRTSGRFHRFSPASYLLISMMDGTRSLDEIFDLACGRLDDETLTQDEVIRLVGQLHAADVLNADLPPDIAEVVERGEQQRRKTLMASILNPLALRVPLFDPDDVITATMPLVRPFLSWFGALLWLAVVSYGSFLALSHWRELTENVVDRVLTAGNLGLLVLSYVAVKTVHELGHAFVIKRWGGSVHEIGVMLLVFMPVPYVDASDAMSFNDKWRRALVGAAGILVEVLLAACAMIVWTVAEEGLLRAFAFNVMLIGGISTLLFNGNPLLKFDGYYVMSDLIEIPNLAQRSKTYLAYLIKRRAFGMTHVESPATGRGEEGWFLFYAIASFVYRVFITFAILLFVSTKFFFLGVILAIWAVVLMFGWPLARQFWFLLADPGLRRNRGRAFAVTGAVLAVVLAGFLAVPLPHNTMSEGVVWVSGDRVIHSEADGLVLALAAEPDAPLTPGMPIARLEDPLAAARARMLDGYIAELGNRIAAQSFSDQMAARVLRQELAAARADKAVTDDRLASLVVRSDVEGRLILPGARDLVGRMVRKGDVIAYVTDFRDPLIRVIVPESRSDLVRTHTRRIEVRFASDPRRVEEARIERVVPGMTATLPSLALATVGGGGVALDPSVPDQRQALSKLLHLDMRLAEGARFRQLGERVHVRFVHDPEPLAVQVYRLARQVFLSNFSI